MFKQKKTEDIEQVFEVVSDETDIDWEKFASFRQMTWPDLRLLPSVPIESQRKSRLKNCSKLSKCYCGKTRWKASVQLTTHWQQVNPWQHLISWTITVYGRSEPNAIKKTTTSCWCELWNETSNFALCEASNSEKIDWRCSQK